MKCGGVPAVNFKRLVSTLPLQATPCPCFSVAFYVTAFARHQAASAGGATTVSANPELAPPSAADCWWGYISARNTDFASPSGEPHLPPILFSITFRV